MTSDEYEVQPISNSLHAVARPPGSKSLTNRALNVAALARGTSQLSGALDCRDTEVMIESLTRLGVSVAHHKDKSTIDVVGCDGRPPAATADLWLENSGTSIRFLTALCALGHGSFQLDGNDRMQKRPVRDLVDGLNGLGADVVCHPETGCPPVTVRGLGLPGGDTTVSGRISSQFLSALLMAAPSASGPVTIRVDGGLVSQPYVDMTMGVMARFGVTVDCGDPACYRVRPQSYQGTRYDIEPDASAASYFFAAAAICGGDVTVQGLSHCSLQGDMQFVEALERMGCRVDWQADRTTVYGGHLTGIDVDMNAISDTAQTMAVVAAFADSPTRIRGVAHIRHKETDRIHAVVTELSRLGIRVEEHDDGFTIHPGPIQAATIETYDDHRMAMSFAVIGLKVPGVRIADPGCTAKTYPHFFDDLERLCGRTR